MSALRGELDTTITAGKVEWKIPNFFSLKYDTDDILRSTSFDFFDATWYMKMYPNGESSKKTDGQIGLYLTLIDGPVVPLEYCLELLSIDMKNSVKFSDRAVFDSCSRFIGWGKPNFISKTVLDERRLEFALQDEITVVCYLKLIAHNFSKCKYVLFIIK